MAEAEIHKIKYSRVASDYDAELKSANEGNGASIDYKLPDNNTITVREELMTMNADGINENDISIKGSELTNTSIKM